MHGGNQITTAGVYCLASAVFIGFAGLWWTAQPGALPPAVMIGATTGLGSEVAMYLLFWRRQVRFAPMRCEYQAIRDWALILGVGTAALGTIATLLHLAIGGHIALGGLCALTIALVMRGSGSGGRQLRLLAPCFIVLFYVNTAFTGYGRLNIITLGLVALITLSTAEQNKYKITKSITLLGVAPTTIYMVHLRQRFSLDTIGTQLSGIGSIVNPLKTFGDLVMAHEHGQFGFAHGSSFISSGLFWVPRAYWENKPVGFGSVLTSTLYPNLSGTGYSMAGLTWAEWYYNFGWLGLLPMVVIIGLLIRTIDRWRESASSGAIVNRRQHFHAMLSLLLGAYIVNLMWDGSFTFCSRVGQDLIGTVIIFGLSSSKRPHLHVPRTSLTSRKLVRIAPELPIARRTRRRDCLGEQSR